MKELVIHESRSGKFHLGSVLESRLEATTEKRYS